MADLTEIVAARVTIADVEGRPRIVLGLADDGQPAVWLIGRDGAELAILALELEPPDPEEGQTAGHEGCSLTLRGGGPVGGEAVLAAIPESYAAVELLGGGGGSAAMAFIEVGDEANLTMRARGAATSVILRGGRASWSCESRKPGPADGDA